ncbi:MAG: efflux transporter outer membrane subunit [Proteobacteria bacterium]|nr:efflux transporter outer membrane subunit [Pseudomonadota bacterium]
MSKSRKALPARTAPECGRRLRAWACVAALGLMAAGCAVGPDFKRPAAPDVAGYVPAPVTATVATPGVVGGQAQRFVEGAEIPADWWTLFHSRQLNDLIEQALANNHDLKAAEAALTVAHEGVLAQRGAYFPTVTAGVSAVRQRTSAAQGPSSTFSLITPQVSVAYAPDVFGLNRRTVEAAQAQEDATRYQLAAAHLTLTSNVAAAAIQQASLETQIDATRELIAIDTKAVEILKYQVAKGYASRVDLAAQEAQLAQVAATLPDLIKQSAQQSHLLAVLTGRFPSQAPEERFDLSSLTLPTDLPLSLPSTLVAQRPDILQAEANMHAASAGIGIAEANRLPNITLTGDAGTMGLSLAKTFGAGAGFWDLGAAVTAPIFDGGALKHKERGAKAAYVQASEQYRSAVLTGFQNVADTLTALDQDAQALKANAASAEAAKVSLDLSQQQYKDGYASYLSVLTAQQTYQQARIALVQAQANRYADTAALFQALGGGWWSRTDLIRNADAR